VTDTLSVGELYTDLEDVFAAAFGYETWIHGEIRNYFLARSGHAYFDLIDPDHEGANPPSLSITLFKSDLRNVAASLRSHGGGVELAVGVRVRIAGRVGAYPQRSTLQLRMTAIDPTFTIGAIEQERERVLALMASEGLLDLNARLTVPVLPLRIALITSVGSAAHADVLHEFERWGIGFEILQIDARTQGAEAVPTIVSGLQTADRLQADVVMLVRGGGARTDLVAFDHELVARTIAAMSTPVFTGVGHEIDRTVVDDVAHSDFKTPTACASAIAERARHAADGFEQLAELVPVAARQVLQSTSVLVEDRSARAARAATNRLSTASLVLNHAAARTSPAALRRLDSATATVGELARRLGPAALQALANATGTVDLASAKAAAHDPAAALARGWSLTRRSDGSVVRSIEHIEHGDTLTTLVAGGVITSTVSTITPSGQPGTPNEGPVQ